MKCPFCTRDDFTGLRSLITHVWVHHTGTNCWCGARYYTTNGFVAHIQKLGLDTPDAIFLHFAEHALAGTVPDSTTFSVPLPRKDRL